MLKNGLTILSIVAIASVLSGCLTSHPTFPKPPAYRECGYAKKYGKPVFYCEWMNANYPPEVYPFTEGFAARLLSTPLVDIPNVEGYEAQVEKWVGNNCSGK